MTSNTESKSSKAKPSDKTDLEPFPNIFEFLFRSPLYQQYSFDDKSTQLKALLRCTFRVDGHCPFCGRQSTFEGFAGDISNDDWQRLVSGGRGYDGQFRIRCARTDGHIITFHLLTIGQTIQKVGQYPSFADVANDESKQYRSLLSREDAAEFPKAIGLAAHGVGIGAYVYIRRIFERLIHNRFAEWKDKEEWSEAEFEKLRMAERIEFLKDHLPPFLVKNRKLYSILSMGIHELNEPECLGFFNVIRLSTIYILEEDKRKKEELAQRDRVEREIEKYASSKGNRDN